MGFGAFRAEGFRAPKIIQTRSSSPGHEEVEVEGLKALKVKLLILQGLGFRAQFSLKYAARCPHPEADCETAASSFLFL